MRALRIGTRGSALARAQTALVADALRAAGHAVEVVVVRTAGDRAQADASMMLARGAWVGELERTLLGGEIDLGVHSAKDLPTDETPGTVLAAFPPRGDPRDALVSRDGAGLVALAAGARIGTESPRRRAFLLHARPDLEPVAIRGNVDTRLAKLDAGEVDALVVAVAGLERLGRTERIAETIDPEVMIPAVGQGALAVQTAATGAGRAAARALDDRPTRAAVVAERAFLSRMGGGCRAPYAALGTLRGDALVVEGAAIDPGGGVVLRDRAEGPAEDAAGIGVRLADALLERGAAALAGR